MINGMQRHIITFFYVLIPWTVSSQDLNISDLDCNRQNAEEIEVYKGEHEDYILAEIQDMKFQDQLVYVADQSVPQVLILSQTGDLITEVSRSGRGPGEYVSPQVLSITDDELIILDKSLGRLTRFLFKDESEKLEIQATGSHDLYINDMCISGGRNMDLCSA